MKRHIWLLPAFSQVASSIGNFVVPYFGLKFLGLEEFGSMSIAYIGILFLSQIVRSGIGEAGILKIREQGSSPDLAPAIAIIGSLFASVLAILVFFVGYCFLQFSELLFAASIAIVGVSVAESVKLSLLSNERVWASAFVDLCWLFAEVIGLLWLVYFSKTSAESLFIIWGLSAILAGAPWLLIYGYSASSSQLSLKPFSKHGPRLALDCAILYAGPLGLIALLGMFGGATQVGMYQAATFLYRPVQLILSAVSVAILTAHSRSYMVVHDIGKAGFFLLSMLACTILITWYLPEYIGIALLSENWSVAKSLWLVGALNTGFWVMGQLFLFVLKVHAMSGALVVAKALVALTFLGVGISIRIETPMETAIVVAVGSTVGAIASVFFYLKSSKCNSEPLNSN